MEELKNKIARFQAQYDQLMKEGKIDEAQWAINAMKKAKSVLAQYNEIPEPVITEKKNDSASSVEQSAVATSADAQQQSSATKPSDERSNLDVEIPVNDGNIGNDIALGEKWVGLAHESKFKSTDAYEQFMKYKSRLKTLVTNWLNSKRKRDGDLKKNLAIDICREMERVVRNDAKAEYKDLLLNLKFSVTCDHTRYQYGCDISLLDKIFNSK